MGIGSTIFFSYGSDAVEPLVFSNRQIELNSGNATLNNNATNGNCTVTINTDLLVTANASRTFTLGGSNAGNNTFAGAITNKTGYVTSLTKANGGKWILTGANTYSGNTTIQDGPLEIRGAGQLGAGGVYPGNITSTDTTPSPFIFDSSANTTISGTISGGMSFTKDGAGTLSITGSAVHTGGTTVAGGTLSLGDGTNSASLSDFGTLSVASGAVVNLNYTGPDHVFYLNLDGSPAAAGTWGATGSGATHIDNTHFTGTGVIYNLAGDLTAAGIAFWDGGSDDIGSDGNAASAGGAGAWNTTTTNWDVGFTAHSAWLNTGSSKAVFAGAENANRTVTLAGAVNIGELSFETTGSAGTRYIIDGGTLNFGAGGMIRTADNRYDQTITSAITGSPAVETKDFGVNNQYKGLKFAPTTGNTQTLGAVLNPNNTGNQDKAGFTLAGSSTGNSVASINYAGGDQYGQTYLQSGEWSIPGGIRTGNLIVTGGTFTLGGTVKLDYNGLDATGGVIKGTFTLGADDRRTSHYMKSGSTISPGNSIGTITVDWDNSQTPSAGENDFSLWFQDGSTYNWEVGAGNTTDKIHFVDGRLYVDNMTINIIGAGGTPSAGDQLPIFTYDVGVTVDITGFANSFGPLPAGWTGTPSLGHDTVNRVIYVTGISGGTPATPYDTWLAGFDFSAYTSPDLTATGNPDGDAHTNLQEFAFGFNPAVSNGGGMLTISGGSITQNGPPQIYEDPGTHQFFLRYTRRADYAAAGLTYTAQFAADSLGTGSFEDVAGGSVVGTGTGAGGVAIEAVAIEFPDALPGSGKKARFGRVEVIQAP
jgi:autotransporter-associated beta strand protein